MKRKLLLSTLMINISYGQTPFNDSNWNIVFEDNFDGNTVNTTVWNHAPPWSSCHGDAG